MASGVINGTTSNQYIVSKIEWSSVADKSTKSSKVTATLYYKRTNTGYTTKGTASVVMTFINTSNGSQVGLNLSPYVSITEDGWTRVGTVSTTIKHNADGTLRIRISASGGIPGTTLSNTYCSGEVGLDTIVVASTITSASDVMLGSNCSVKWTPNYKDNRYRLKFQLGAWSYTTDAIHPNQATAYTYSAYPIPLVVANQIPNSKTGTMTVTLYTYSDSSATQQEGSASSKTFTVTVPENDDTKPTVSMSLSPSSNLPSPYNSLYIQGRSKVKATLGFTTEYGATVVASNITVNGNTYASPYESDILSQAGKVSVKATVKDSRGFYGTIYKDIEVIPYSKPYIQAKSGESSIIAARCDSSATFTESGTYLKIKVKAVYSKVTSGGVQYNYGKVKFRYRKEGGSYSAWQTILDCKADKSDEVITPPLLNGALDIKYNYQVQIIASDDLHDSVPITIAVPSDAVYMDRPAGGKSMGLGGYSSGDGNFDVYWKTKARGGLSMFNSQGKEIPLDSTLPLPCEQVEEGWSPDNLECGIYAVTSAKALKQGDTVIMYNGVLIQMTPHADDSRVKIQLALTSDENKNPYYRVYWYGNWGNWRSFKL